MSDAALKYGAKNIITWFDIFQKKGIPNKHYKEEDQNTKEKVAKYLAKVCWQNRIPPNRLFEKLEAAARDKGKYYLSWAFCARNAGKVVESIEEDEEVLQAEYVSESHTIKSLYKTYLQKLKVLMEAEDMTFNRALNLLAEEYPVEMMYYEYCRNELWESALDVGDEAAWVLRVNPQKEKIYTQIYKDVKNARV